jgi:DNA-binding NarL/FixJ family response regulator
MPPGEVKPEWIEVLNLAFEEGLEDKVIALRMRVAPRTVRHYWTKVQDVLGVYPKKAKVSAFKRRNEPEKRGLLIDK